MMEQPNLESMEEPVIELVRDGPLGQEKEEKIVRMLKKLGGRSPVSVLETKLGAWIYDSLERMVIKRLIKVK